jgi:choline monooxygenase
MSRFQVDKDIAVARTLSTDFYLNPSSFEEAKQKIFDCSWHFISSDGVVASQNDCYPFTLLKHVLREPLVLVKDKNGIIRCLSNVCTHRGNILVSEPCNQPHLRCKYHGRLFHQDGKFRSMPEFKEVKDFPGKEDDLVSLPLFKMGNWLFTSLNGKYSATVFFKDMLQRVSWLPLEEFSKQPLYHTFSVNAHWALYCENYLEGFHIPFVHAGLNAVIDFGAYTTELYPYSNLQLGIAKEGELCFDLPSSSPDYGKKIAAYYFFIFPNMMFNLYPWGLSLNIVEPITMNKTKVHFLSYVWKQELYNQGAGSSLDKVEMEDEEIVESVQKGIRSSFYRHGRYSVTREQGTHHFHRLICEFMNA